MEGIIVGGVLLGLDIILFVYIYYLSGAIGVSASTGVVSGANVKVETKHNIEVKQLLNGAEKFIKTGDLSSALFNYQNIINGTLENKGKTKKDLLAKANSGLGFICFKNGNYNKSCDYYTKSLFLDPKEYNSYVMRGEAYRKQNNFQPAINDFTKAIELNPKGYIAYYNRAVLYYNIQNFELALDDFKFSVKCNPKHEKSKLKIKEISDYFSNPHQNYKIIQQQVTQQKKYTQNTSSNSIGMGGSVIAYQHDIGFDKPKKLVTNNNNQPIYETPEYLKNKEVKKDEEKKDDIDMFRESNDMYNQFNANNIQIEPNLE